MISKIRTFFYRLRLSIFIRDSKSLWLKNLEVELDLLKKVEGQTLALIHVVEERSRSLELALRDTLTLLRVVEERSRSLEYATGQAAFAAHHQIDLLQKLYVESMPALLGLNKKFAFNAACLIELKTDFPIAAESYDHIRPDSTTEGVSRPTVFVQNCISVLGEDIKCLDLGTGAAGLVFEYAMNDVLAIGVDGSDFCRVNKIGYWPLLPNNLFTCDITKPFSFVSQDRQDPIQFDVITMWEVLEHIAEKDLPDLFSNIEHHLESSGYFIGSISLLEYKSSSGIPYHLTLKPREWWGAKLLESGMVMLATHPFNESFFCRGNGPRFQDFHNYAANSSEGFTFVAKKVAAT